ncbi:unnamed protein product [Brassica oleracea]
MPKVQDCHREPQISYDPIPLSGVSTTIWSTKRYTPMGVLVNMERSKLSHLRRGMRTT